jgi:hypothetical protein
LQNWKTSSVGFTSSADHGTTATVLSEAQGPALGGEALEKIETIIKLAVSDGEYISRTPTNMGLPKCLACAKAQRREPVTQDSDGELVFPGTFSPQVHPSGSTERR